MSSNFKSDKSWVSPQVRRCMTGLAVAWWSCSGSPDPIAPMGMSPIAPAVVANWIAPFESPTAREYVIRPWRYQNERGAASGRATVQLVPPDSMRFDYVGPFRRNGRAALIGDTTLWYEPEADLGAIMRQASFFWAAMGLPLPPPGDRDLVGLVSGDLRAWQYQSEEGTITFVLRGDPATSLVGELRRDGKQHTLVTSTLDPRTGLVVSSQIQFPQSVARFDFQVDSVVENAAFDRALLWSNTQR